MARPKVGEIIDGYEYVGGDPQDQTSWQEWGAGARRLPTGEIVRDGPRGGMTVHKKPPAGSESDPLREFEVNAAARATLMDQGQTDYNQAIRDGYKPGSFLEGVYRGMETLPVVGNAIGAPAANLFRSDSAERGRAAELQFVDGALRTTSGANAPEPEVLRANRAYFRQPGEGEGVEDTKGALRERFRAQSVRTAGRAYVEPAKKTGGPMPIPKAAESAYMKRYNAGQIDKAQPRGSAANPFLARDEATANRLPVGSHVILPDGSLGVVE